MVYIQPASTERTGFKPAVGNRGTGTVSARAVVANPNLALMPGQFVRVVVKGINKPNAITVPERALSQGPNGTFVYVVDDQGLARIRPIGTAHTANGRWVVESGIEAGDKVIVEGLPKVHPNAPVKVVDPPPPFDAVDWDADPDWEWRTAAEDDPVELRDLYDGCVRRADAAVDEVLAGAGLDTESVRPSREGGAFSLRWILLHMIEEYARHNGHADLIRESIDGETGE